jgi:hypothetical protein
MLWTRSTDPHPLIACIRLLSWKPGSVASASSALALAVKRAGRSFAIFSGAMNDVPSSMIMKDSTNSLSRVEWGGVVMTLLSL